MIKVTARGIDRDQPGKFTEENHVLYINPKHIDSVGSIPEGTTITTSGFTTNIVVRESLEEILAMLGRLN